MSIREGWREISSAPKDGTRVLICDDSGCMYLLRWNGHYWDDGDYHSDYEDSDFSHWMPLPDPPAQGAQS